MMSKITLTQEQGKHLGLDDLPCGFTYDREYTLLQISNIEINDELHYRHYLCLETKEILEVLEDLGTSRTTNAIKTPLDIFCTFRNKLQQVNSEVVIDDELKAKDRIILHNDNEVQVSVSLDEIIFMWLDVPEDEKLARSFTYLEDYAHAINNMFTVIL